MKLSNILEGLNDSQKEAATMSDGPVLVIAGPGTGKTLTISRRIAYLIHEGAAPEHILALTFTNRAAREMMTRTRALLGEKSSSVFIGTFHLLGLIILRDMHHGDFVICDRNEQVLLLKSIVQELRNRNALSAERISYTKLADSISRAKNRVEDTADELKEVSTLYQSVLKKKHAFDFDDLILHPATLLDGGRVAETYRKIFRYIIIDEYQDINKAQFRFLRLLTGETNNICAVGDADQAIYAFRGADMDNFLDFEKDFTGTKRIYLTENYRSTGTILHASSMFIQHNRKRLDKELSAKKEKGDSISLVSVPDEKAEGEWIIREIEQRMGGTSHYRMHTLSDRNFPDKSYSFSDFAVIYRTHAQAKVLEEAFMASGIPYQVVGGRNSLQSKATEDTLTYMKSLINVPAEHDNNDVQIDGGLLGPADFFDPSADAVALMTMHMAKGLEFSVVFLTGAEEGILPYTLKDDEIDIEEERRLFYVGMTRAKDELFIMHARKRFLYGKRLTPSPSPFISEVPWEYVEKKFIPDGTVKRKEDQQIRLF